MATSKKAVAIKESAKETKVETPVFVAVAEPIKVEEPKLEPAPEPIVVEVKKESPNQVLDTESDEIRFLRRLHKIQNDGGFGTHLNKEINDRIEILKKK